MTSKAGKFLLVNSSQSAKILSAHFAHNNVRRILESSKLEMTFKMIKSNNQHDQPNPVTESRSTVPCLHISYIPPGMGTLASLGSPLQCLKLKKTNIQAFEAMKRNFLCFGNV